MIGKFFNRVSPSFSRGLNMAEHFYSNDRRKALLVVYFLIESKI